MKIANMFYKIAKGIKDAEPTPEHQAALTKLLGKIRANANEGKLTAVVYNKDIEGKNFNLRGVLSAEGFVLIERPGKMVYILWNC